MKKGKKYTEAAKLIDRTMAYDTAEAVALVKKAATAKFDETVEAHIRTGCDGRHAEQQIRGAVVLPHGTGKTVRVLVFAKGDKANEAEAAGADYVGGEDSWTGYGDDRVNEALAKTQTTSDMDEIKGLYSVVDQKVQEDVPMFSAYIVSAQAAVNKRLSNATPSVYGFFNNVEQWEITK